jgi:hypothetical protein
MEFCFNRRDNPYLFRDPLLVLLQRDALVYRVLIDQADPGELQRENDALIRREAERQARQSLKSKRHSQRSVEVAHLGRIKTGPESIETGLVNRR